MNKKTNKKSNIILTFFGIILIILGALTCREYFRFATSMNNNNGCDYTLNNEDSTMTQDECVSWQFTNTLVYSGELMILMAILFTSGAGSVIAVIVRILDTAKTKK